MIELNAEDVARINAKLTSMVRKLDHFGKVELGQVMSGWQVEEMHRHRPFTMRWTGRKRQVRTVVRPHSLREVLGERAYRRKILHLKTARRAPRQRHRRLYRRWSSRPILREMLEAQLWKDMTEAFARAISWKD